MTERALSFAEHIRRIAGARSYSLDWSPPEVPTFEAENAEREKQKRYPLRIHDVEDKARAVRFRRSGKRKRRGKVDLRARRIVIVLHQSGFVRSHARMLESAHRINCHRAVDGTGARFRVHPLDAMLWAADAFNYKPFHAINIEVIGNFGGNGPDGPHWRPDKFGKSILEPAQRTAVRAEIRTIVSEVEDAGVHVSMIAPHRVSGNDRKGRPNRPLCCGREIWEQCGEWAADALMLPTPRPGESFGGSPIPDAWRGQYGQLYPSDGSMT